MERKCYSSEKGNLGDTTLQRSLLELRRASLLQAKRKGTPSGKGLKEIAITNNMMTRALEEESLPFPSAPRVLGRLELHTRNDMMGPEGRNRMSGFQFPPDLGNKAGLLTLTDLQWKGKKVPYHVT